MPSSNRIYIPLQPMVEGFAVGSQATLNQMSQQIAQALSPFMERLRLDIDPASITNLQQLESALQSINATISQSGNSLTIMARSADGMRGTIQLLQQQGQVLQNTTTYSANRISSVQQLNQAYNNLINTQKLVNKLEEQGKKGAGYQKAVQDLEFYQHELENLIATIQRRYGVQSQVDEQTNRSILLGQGQLAQTQRAREQELQRANAIHQTNMAEKEQAEIQAQQAAIQVQQQQAGRQYLSLMQQLFTAEVQLNNLQRSGASQEAILAQQQLVDVLRQRAQTTRQTITDENVLRQIEEQLTIAEAKRNAQMAKGTSTIKKQQSLFGNLIASMKSVIKTSLMYSIAYGSIYKVTQAVTDTIDTIKELNKITTDLRIVTGKTTEQAEEMVRVYSDMAKELGATTKEVGTAAVEWQRQGYSVNDTNTLIKNSMILSKVGMIESAEAQQYLTSTMKGYNVSVRNSLDIVDQLTSIDMKAAVSAGGLAEAMSRTANSANLAGVEMNQLLGYLAVVGEVTQKSMSSVGESFKTIFARFGNIKAGKFVDDETGESLNDVAKVLSKFNIALYDAQGNMNDVGDILSIVASKWDKLTAVEQNAIATAVAGTRQRENFLVLMENYEKATEYSTLALESEGTAMEKFGAHTDSIEGKLNSLSAATEKWSQNLIDSGLVKGIIDMGTGLVTLADNLHLVQGAIYLLVGVGLLKLPKLLIATTTAIGQGINKFKNYSVVLNAAANAQKLGGSRLVAYQNLLNTTGVSLENYNQKQLLNILTNLGLEESEEELNEEKIKTLLMTNGVEDALASETAAKFINITATKTQTASQLDLVAALKIQLGQLLKNIAAFVAANAAIVAVVAVLAVLAIAIIACAQAEKKRREEAKKSLEQLKEIKSEYESLNSELEENKKRILELEKLPARTYVEDEELAKLKEATLELQAQVDLSKQKEIGASQNAYIKNKPYIDNMLTNPFGRMGETLEESKNAILSELELDPSQITSNNEDEVWDAVYEKMEEINRRLEEEYYITTDIIEEGEKRLEEEWAYWAKIANQTGYGYFNGKGSPTFSSNDIASKISKYDELTKKIQETSDAEERLSLIEERNLLLYGDGDKNLGIVDNLNEVKEVIDGLEGMTSEAAIETFGSMEAYTQKLESYKNAYENYLKALFPEQWIRQKFNSILDSFDGAKAKIQDFINTGASEVEITEYLKTNYASLITKMDEYGITIEDIIKQFKTMNSETTQNVKTIEDLKKEIDSLSQTYEDVNSIVEDYNTNGSISYENLEKLLDLDVKYLAALVDENGQIKANTSALEALTKARIEEAYIAKIEEFAKAVSAATTKEEMEALLGAAEAQGVLTEAHLQDVAALMALNPLVAEYQDQIWAVFEGINQLFGSIRVGGNNTSNAEKATEKYEKALAYVNKTIEDEIELLEQEREAIEKEIQEKIKAKEKEIELLEKEKEALEDKNEEKNKEIELEELQRNLQKARQRTMRVYHADKGWVWEQNPEEVQKAQQELDDFYTEQEIDNIDKKIEALEEEVEALERTTDEEDDLYDKRLKQFDKQIKKLEDYKQKWNEVKENYEHQQNELIAQQMFGADAEAKILDGRVEILEDFKTGYTNALGEAASKTQSYCQDMVIDLSKVLDLLKQINAYTGDKAVSEFEEEGITSENRVYDARSRETIIKTGASGDKYIKIGEGKWVNLEDTTSEGSYYHIKEGVPIYFNPYASGTKSASKGLANVDEKGRELIIPKQGRYRMMEYGDIVLPNNLSNKMFEVATNPLKFITNALNSTKIPILSGASSESNSTIISIGTIELPQVTNGENFIKQLKIIAANR